ncbi:MAG: zinc-dependent metalloprotease [Candidatus Bipolaricaulota bacterium]|nr:zinc-dependent metalloprotease [Candidatus Bipolaricaulota bacterium]MCS7274924.1 zinc-dependent metalloprotease [Candidatus Bipolaricaulota bacterium]MDW8110291.1 zinc-dependent metalloprotease [Candidatus Bipolaricaulota bacterium]MDW8328813.1 zinc-dependent metalloprotease [Candidatus Bipolaricaulota bacterium]
MRMIRRITVAVLLVVALAVPFVGQEAPGKGPIEAFVAEMKSIPGYFNAYLKRDGTLYLEISRDQFNKDFLVIVQMARGIGESFLLTGYPLDSDLLQFRMRNDKIELWTRNPYFRADPGTPLGQMVELGFRDSVRRSFAIVARDETAGRYLIDATGLFLSDWPNLGDYLPGVFRTSFRLDPTRSAITSVKGFPRNVEIDADLTFAANAPMQNVPPRVYAVLPDEKTLPVALHYSILALPEQPMKPRLADDRVGYFVTTYKDYSRQTGPTNSVRLVNRWRLEKKDPYAPLSEPVKPIIFYIENTVPKELRPYVKEGVEAWNKAFEAAGFKNAILALDQPNDPHWDPADARYSTIRWMPSVSSVFAMGPSDVDPRSGEILNADILFTADWVRALTNEYLRMVESPMQFLQDESEALEIARTLNPHAASLLCSYEAGMAPHMATLMMTLAADGLIAPGEGIPLEYVGAAIRETVMHEVGHALGLRHNFKASVATPFEQLHNKDYTSRYGITASVMEYNPPNISSDREHQGEYFNSTVGPWDIWAIKWGYTPVGNERLAPHPQLQEIALQHSAREHLYGTDEDAWLYPYALDPLITQWDLSADPVAYYKDLQKLVARLWERLEDRLLAPDDEYWPLRGAVNTLLFQELRGYIYYVKALGGMTVTRAHKGDELTPLKPLSAEEQRKALRFVTEIFSPEVQKRFPKHFLDKMPRERWWDWASSWQPNQRFHFPIHDAITGMRVQVLTAAFWPERLLRITDNAYRSDEEDPYTLDEHFKGFTDAIWGDVLSRQPPTDSFQRAIQSIYLDMLIAMVKDETPNRLSDAVAMAYAELVRLDKAIGDLLVERADLDALSKAHLLEAQRRIRQIVVSE